MINLWDSLQLALYRHWTIESSLYNTRFSACKLKIWSLNGERRLQQLLADVGLVFNFKNFLFEIMNLILQNSVGAEQAEVLCHGPAASARILWENGGTGGQVRTGRNWKRGVHPSVRIPPAILGRWRHFLNGRSPRVFSQFFVCLLLILWLEFVLFCRSRERRAEWTSWTRWTLCPGANALCWRRESKGQRSFSLICFSLCGIPSPWDSSTRLDLFSTSQSRRSFFFNCLLNFDVF